MSRQELLNTINTYVELRDIEHEIDERYEFLRHGEIVAYGEYPPTPVDDWPEDKALYAKYVEIKNAIKVAEEKLTLNN